MSAHLAATSNLRAYERLGLNLAVMKLIATYNIADVRALYEKTAG